MLNSKICIVSGHYPEGVFFTEITKRLLVNYCNFHDYDLYYDSHTKVDDVFSEFHFRRCLILKKASENFPNADWYIWLDTDIYIQTPKIRIESYIDLTQPDILYHLFHEKPWKSLVNTGVKIVSKNALELEEKVYSMRANCPYPFEQKIMADFILPRYKHQIIIHNPEKLNCIYHLHDNTDALFVHVCSRSELDKNLIILNKTMHFFKENEGYRQSKYYKYYYVFFLINNFQKFYRKSGIAIELAFKGEFKRIFKIIVLRSKGSVE